MNKYSGILRCVTVMIITVVMLLYMSAKCLGFDGEILFDEKNISASLGAVEYESEKSEDTVETPVENVTDSTAETSAEPIEESVAVSSGGNVLGKIIDKTISPYSASSSYNGVYLKNSTGLKVDIKTLLSESLNFKVESESNPQVLIMHTHTTESFMLENRDYYTDKDSARRTDENYNMVKLGNIVEEKLNAAGISTLHDKTMHDYPSYNGSYTRAAATINGYLKKYPSIKIVIDMHRDAVQSDNVKTKLTTDINGRKAAQVMLVMGSQSGSVTNFPNWKENLKLALRFQQTMEVMYPSLARPLSLTSKNYNESLTNGSMLLEIGTDANTLEEAEYSSELVGDALVSLLNTLK